jgi:predicted RND superfamily exporter protein
MKAYSKRDWVIAIISLVVFILTFFILFRETQEIFSSLTAAIFSALLVWGALIIISWLIRVFTK